VVDPRASKATQAAASAADLPWNISVAPNQPRHQVRFPPIAAYAT
jgi:hypothetical protein